MILLKFIIGHCGAAPRDVHFSQEVPVFTCESERLWGPLPALCHPEQSEGSLAGPTAILRSAQDDSRAYVNACGAASTRRVYQTAP